MTIAYYNEFDPFAAAWLNELIAASHIAPGLVDTRSIEDVTPNDLRGFTQCHFFAGIGVWSLAARRAGWADDRPLWTGSCPCQPFSAAGKGGGFADERHLWPSWAWLIGECRPVVVAGEQVASSNVDPWLDLVQADVEGMDYAFGCVPSPSAGYGAPHIRDRAFWVADARRTRAGWNARTASSAQTSSGIAWCEDGRDGGHAFIACCATGGLDDAERARLERLAWDGDDRHQSGRLITEQGGHAAPTRLLVGLADAGSTERRTQPQGRADEQYGHDARGNQAASGLAVGGEVDRPGPTNGLWRDADWLGCTDGKWRPVMPETFPLAHAGAFRNRVGTLRGAGNAINLAQATEWMRAIS